mgnify:CR=1 FL=1
MNTIKKVLGNTTLAIAMLTILAVGGAGYAAGTSYSSNLVKVEKCIQLANGISITRSGINFGNPYNLMNGCKDTGHGKRDYTFSCKYTGGYGYGYNPDSILTTYSVSWQPCSIYGYGYAN